jgi:glucose/arabinose dehydrogenase
LFVLPTLVAAVLAAPAGLASAVDTDAAVTVPPGFTDTVLLSGLGRPMALAFLPDGRMLIAVKSGQLRVVSAGKLLPTPAIDLRTQLCTNRDRGLMGVAVDPQFTTNRFIYLFWTRKIDPACSLTTLGAAEDRIVRYRLGDDNVVEPGSDKVIVDHIPSLTFHNGGDLHFGTDGLLYASVGDGSCAERCGLPPDKAQRLDLPIGKMLRVTRSGGVPATNPYASSAGARRCVRPAGPQPGTGPCAEIYASGLRNPFRFAVGPDGTMNVNDVGESTWEEVDRLVSGGNYGWPVCEGAHLTGTTDPCGNAAFLDPIAEYNHSTGCVVVTGGAFVPGRVWGPEHRGAYLFADFACGQIFELHADGSVSSFVTEDPGIVAMQFGPFGTTRALYYVTQSGTGQLHRLSR